jgi:hypothetical protein
MRGDCVRKWSYTSLIGVLPARVRFARTWREEFFEVPINKFFDTYGAFALAGALLIGFAAAMCILNYTDYMYHY